MAGILDDLFDPKTYDPQGGVAGSQMLAADDDYSHDGLDYASGVPIIRRKKTEEKFDEGKKKFDEAHPYVPSSGEFPAFAPKVAAPQGTPQMAGMLTPEMNGPYGTVSSNGNVGIMGADPNAGLTKPPLPQLPTTNVAPPPEPVAPQGSGLPGGVANANAQQPAATPQVRGSPADGAIDMRDAPLGMLGKVWDGIKNNSNLLLGLGAGLTGAPSWAQGFSRGFAGGAAGAAQDQRLNLATGGQNALYQTLVSAMSTPGMTPQELQQVKLKAIAATTNKPLADALIAQHITEPKVQIEKLTDSMGNQSLRAVPKNMPLEDIARFNAPDGGGGSGGTGALPQLAPIDPATGQIMPKGTPIAANGVPGNALAQAAPGQPPVADEDAPQNMQQLNRLPIQYDPQTGRDEKFAEAFKRVDPTNYAAVEKLINGDISAAGRNLQPLKKYASRMDSTFTEANFPARQKLYNSYYGDGAGAKQLLSANTAVDHGTKLAEAIKELNNFSILPGFMNPVTGAISSQYNKAYQAARTKFNVNADIFAHELEFATTGKNTVAGTNAFKKEFDVYAPPAANFGALDKGLQLLNERIGEREASYKMQMGHNARNPFDTSGFFTHRPEMEQILAHGAENFNPTRPGAGGPPRVSSPAEAAKLPKGTRFVDPNGVERIVP
jgi:hypothetical protein